VEPRNQRFRATCRASRPGSLETVAGDHEIRRCSSNHLRLLSGLGLVTLGRMGRAVQRCRLAVTESALQHLMVEVRWLIARGIPEPAIV